MAVLTHSGPEKRISWSSSVTIDRMETWLIVKESILPKHHICGWIMNDEWVRGAAENCIIQTSQIYWHNSITQAYMYKPKHKSHELTISLAATIIRLFRAQITQWMIVSVEKSIKRMADGTRGVGGAWRGWPRYSKCCRVDLLNGLKRNSLLLRNGK